MTFGEAGYCRSRASQSQPQMPKFLCEYGGLPLRDILQFLQCLYEILVECRRLMPRSDLEVTFVG